MRPKGSSVAAGAVIFSVGMLVSRLLGLIRERLLVNVFPDRMVTDAYNSAFNVPDLLYFLLAGGAMSAAFIPTFTGYLTRGEDEQAQRVGSTIANLLLIVMVVGAALEIIFAPAIVRLVAPGYAPGSPVFDLTVNLTRIMCVMVIFTAQSGFFTGVLNSYRHFLAPVVVWNVYNVAIILGILLFRKLPWFGRELGIYGVALGVVLGAALMAIIQWAVAWKIGFRLRPLLDLGHAGVRKVFALLPPGMIALSMGQVNLMMVPIIIGSLFPAGAVTDVRLANKLISLPLSLFAFSVATAAFPKLAEQFALGETQGFRDTIARGLRVIMLFSIPATVLILLLAEPLNALLWGGGGYGITDISAAAFVSTFFAFGLLALGMQQLISRAFYSLHDTITPMVLTIAMVAANIPLAMVLSKYTPFAYGGAALATSITTTLFTGILLEVLRRRTGGIGGRSIAAAGVKILLASAAMGVVVYLVANWLAPTVVAGGTTVTMTLPFPVRWPAPDLSRAVEGGIAALPGARSISLQLLIQVGTSTLAGLGVLYLALRALRVEEVHLVTARVLGKLRRRQA